MARRQGGSVVAPIKFSERRQTRRPHPVLEVLVLLQVWYGTGVGVAWVAQHPVRRRYDLIQVIGVTRRGAVFLSLAGPGDARL